MISLDDVGCTMTDSRAQPKETDCWILHPLPDEVIIEGFYSRKGWALLHDGEESFFHFVFRQMGQSSEHRNMTVDVGVPFVVLLMMHMYELRID